MRAALLAAPGRLGVKDVPTPICPEGGVVVEVKACGICTSDVKMAQKGHRALVYPRILGHEISGIVKESNNKEFKEGDRVQVAPGLRCGKCLACKRRADNQCKTRGIFGFTHDGGFAEYMAVPLEGAVIGSLNLLQERLSFEEATLAEPLACCINAQELAGLFPGDRVLIIGAGPMGYLHALLAGQKGAQKIMLAEIDKRRQELALKIEGQVIDTETEDLFRVVMEETEGRGADVLILACSEVVLNESLLKLLAPRARVSLFSGVPVDISQVCIDLNFIHYQEIRIVGSYGSTAAQNAEAIRMISSEELSVEGLVTKRVTLDQIWEGLEYTASRKGMKTVVDI